MSVSDDVSSGDEELSYRNMAYLPEQEHWERIYLLSINRSTAETRKKITV